MIEVVNLSSKGQLVIPKNMREQMGLNPRDKFILVNDRDTILLKKIGEQEIKSRMSRLINRTSAAFRRAGITKEDLKEEITAARKAR